MLFFAAPRVAVAEFPLDTEEAAVVEALNAQRVALGLNPVKVSASLTRTSEWMAADLAKIDGVSHTDTLGRGLRERFSSFGYPANSVIRENVAAGYTSGAAVFKGWTDSPGHYANNVATDPKVVGIARHYDGSTKYKWFWVLTFGSVEDSGTVSLAEARGQAAPAPTPTPAPPAGGTGTGGTSADISFGTTLPASGVALTTWPGGTVDALRLTSTASGVRAVYVFQQGKAVVYLPSAPSFVNSAFLALFPAGNVPSGTVLLVVVGS